MVLILTIGYQEIGDILQIQIFPLAGLPAWRVKTLFTQEKISFGDILVPAMNIKL
ncbi:hypothetical protein ANME2D_03086 [Candidatus Methanoperedens nitroreducens]|uniref:Uncharacterized protein n=1 Tax=Candidatus Methanoperedens nitratireducens TaxID=1392998 RepID=A0A062UVK7_9EURY|nr:hypothetical protein ANME2D_03086 [Candidatus Methanoperedens nitroreducens]